MKHLQLKMPLKFSKNNSIDLVIMDLGLPNMNGIDATKAIHDINKRY